jgi:hypothetical protein
VGDFAEAMQAHRFTDTQFDLLKGEPGMRWG